MYIFWAAGALRWRTVQLRRTYVLRIMRESSSAHLGARALSTGANRCQFSPGEYVNRLSDAHTHTLTVPRTRTGSGSGGTCATAFIAPVSSAAASHRTKTGPGGTSKLKRTGGVPDLGTPVHGSKRFSVV